MRNAECEMRKDAERLRQVMRKAKGGMTQSVHKGGMRKAKGGMTQSVHKGGMRKAECGMRKDAERFTMISVFW